MTSRCQNCKDLETRLTELQSQVLDLEDRRSRERVRYLNEQQKQFLQNSSVEAEFVPKQDIIDLLDLLKRTVEDPQGENLHSVKAQLQKYLI